MPYVQGFNNDVFISFAHTDNTDGWVEAFHIRLKDRLLQIGAQASVWRDNKLRGTDIFSDEIFSHLKDSAVLISIISPSGIRSSWCQDERQKFEKFAELNGGFRIGNTLRAVKVVKTPLENDEHKDLFGTLGYEFYQRIEGTRRFKEFDPSSPEFRDRIDWVAQEILDILNVLCKQNLGSDRPKPSVYVAATSSDLEEPRQSIVRQIEDWGYTVLPTSSLALLDSSSFRSSVNAALAKSLLSVHLVGKQRGLIPEGEEKSIVVLQYELAQSRPAERVLWVAPGQSPDPVVLSSIANDQEGVEILEGRTLEDLKELIEAKLKRLREETSLLRQGKSKFSVYIVCDRKDHPYLNESDGHKRALQLKSYLDNEGYVVWLPPVSSMEETRRRKDHRETLKLSDAVLLYWGAADEVWFRESVRELIKERTRRSGCRRLAEAAYLGGPPLVAKSLYRHQLDMVFEQFEDFQPDVLRPLFERLHQRNDNSSP